MLELTHAEPHELLPEPPVFGITGLQFNQFLSGLVHP
jgi:hypothetical protein